MKRKEMSKQIKKNKTLTMILTGSRVRILEHKADPIDPLRALVEVVNVYPNGKQMKKTRRTVYADSIRRWYVAA